MAADRIRGVRKIAPDQEQYLERVVSTLGDDLGADLIGVYLHGSLAMGAFTPGRSDIDVIAVCTTSISSERSVALGKALAAIPTPRSGGDLEFNLVADDAMRAPFTGPGFEVRVNTHEEPFVVDGHDRPDDYLATDYAMVRARGRSLYGPGPREAIPEPDRAVLIRAFLDDHEVARSEGAAWWGGHDLPESASMAYLVLNGARTLRYLETGELGSKAEGAAWLEQHDPDPSVHALLEAALTYQRGGAPDQPDERVLDAFLDRVEAALRAAAG